MTMPSDHPQAAPAVTDPPAQAADDAMTLSAEQLTSRSTWVRTGTVRLRRRIVTEQRTVSVQVQVRREELVIDSDGVEWDANGVAVGVLPGDPVPPPAGTPAPIVMVLREEVPQVVLSVRPYERVTATVVPVAGQVPVTAQLSREELALDQPDSPSGPSGLS
jgi:stress response protein YsnF